MCRPYGCIWYSLNKDPSFGRFSLKWVSFQELGKKFSKMGSFPPKFIIKVGMTATVGNRPFSCSVSGSTTGFMPWPSSLPHLHQ